MQLLLSHKGKLTLTMLCVLLAIVTGCAQSHPLYPSYEELTQRGFYLYVLPGKIVEQHGWLQTVSIRSWDKHCIGAESSETANPIYVRYDGSQGQSVLTMIIGPWDMAWDHRKPTTEVQVDTPWAMDGEAVYYVIEDYTRLRFEDGFGTPIQIGSRLPITEIVQLITQLEYIGPPQETVTDPWGCSSTMLNSP